MSKPHKSAESVVRDYIDSLETIAEWLGYTPEHYSYSKWAVGEIIKRLETEKESPPLIVIEDFKDKMDTYSCLNSKTWRIFSEARDTAEKIIDALIRSC